MEEDEVNNMEEDNIPVYDVQPIGPSTLDQSVIDQTNEVFPSEAPEEVPVYDAEPMQMDDDTLRKIQAYQKNVELGYDPEKNISFNPEMELPEAREAKWYDYITGVDPRSPEENRRKLIKKDQNNRYIRELAADTVGLTYEGFRETLSKLTRARDSLVDTVTGIDTPSKEEIGFDPYETGKYTPYTDSIIPKIAGLALPAGVGAKAVNATAGILLGGLSRVSSIIASTLGGAGGAALSQSPEDENLLFGGSKGGWLGGFQELDEEGKRNYLSTVVNDFIDNTVTGLGGETVGIGVAKAAAFAWNGFLKPLYYVAIGEPVKASSLRVASAFAHHTDLLKNAQTPQEKAEAVKAFTKFLRENKEFSENLDGEDVKFFYDLVGSMEAGDLADIRPEDAKAMINKARDLRKGQLDSGTDASQLTERLEQPTEKLRETLEQQDVKFSGPQDENIIKAQDKIQTRAEQEFNTQYTQPIADKERELLIAAKKGADDLRNSDPSLWAEITDVKNDVNIDIFKNRNATRDEIKSNIKSAAKNMDKKLQDAAKAIPDDAVIDLTENTEFLVELADTNPVVFKRLQKFIQKGDGEELPDEIKGNFKEIYQDIIPLINKQLQNPRGKEGVANLFELRKIINDAADSLPEGNAFRDYYKDTYAPVWRDGKLGEWKRLWDGTGRRGIKDVDLEAGSNKYVTEMLTGDENYTNQLNHLYNMPDTPGKAELITDWYLQDISGRLQSQINAGKTLSDIDTSTLTRPLEEYASNIAKIAPKEVERLNKFLNKIRNTKSNLNTLQKDLDNFVKTGDKLKDKIFGDQYKNFFDKYFDRSIGAEYANFEKLLTGPSEEVGKRLNRIMQVAEQNGDIDIIEGLKGAYIRTYRRKILDNKRIKSESLRALEEGADPLLTQGKRIFGNDKRLEILESLARKGEEIQSNIAKGRQSSPDLGPSLMTQARSASDKMITMVFGVLNRLGARVRAGAKVAMEDLDPDLNYRRIKDAFYANPEYAADVLDMFASDLAKGDTKSKRMMIDWIIWQLPPDSDPLKVEQTVNEYYDQLFGTPNVDQQMEQLQLNNKPITPENVLNYEDEEPEE